MEDRLFYNEVLTDHNKHPYHKCELDHPDLMLEGVNPSCGDDIYLQLKMDGDIIADGAFVGDGCAISQASTDNMLEMIIGRTKQEAIRLADMAATVDADIYVHSHTHLPMIFTESYFRTNAGNSSVQEVEKLFVNTGATLQYGGYGQRNVFKPASRRYPVIHLDALTGIATATL